MTNTTVIQVAFNKTYQVEDDMFKAVYAAVMQYANQVSLVSAIGVLELVKDGLIREAE